MFAKPEHSAQIEDGLKHQGAALQERLPPAGDEQE
jgi:hypothetical protein